MGNSSGSAFRKDAISTSDYLNTHEEVILYNLFHESTNYYEF